MMNIIDMATVGGMLMYVCMYVCMEGLRPNIKNKKRGGNI